jgi:hypothetical protein
VPFVVIVTVILVGLGAGHSSPDSTTTSSDGALPAITAAAPPHAAQQAANCAKVLAALPVSLGKLDPRIVHTKPDTPFVVAWGDPAVQLSCGVAKPKALYPGSSVEFITGGEFDGPYYDVQKVGDANVFTTVDRGPYIALRIPAKYPAADYLPVVSRAIARAVPAVCVGATSAGVDPDKLCTRRTS